jgi:hypothetical protein
VVDVPTWLKPIISLQETTTVTATSSPVIEHATMVPPTTIATTLLPTTKLTTTPPPIIEGLQGTKKAVEIKTTGATMEAAETSMVKSKPTDGTQTPFVLPPTDLTLYVTSILPCGPNDYQCMVSKLIQILGFILVVGLVCFCMNWCSLCKLKRTQQNRRTYGDRRGTTDVVEAFELRPLQPITLTTFTTVNETVSMPVPPPLPPPSQQAIRQSDQPAHTCYKEAITSCPTVDMLMAAKNKLKPVAKE